MDHLSEAPHRRDSPCKGLLITASIFSCWMQPMSAQDAPITVVSIPPYGMVGSRVILSIQGFSKIACRYTWYRKSAEHSNQIISYHLQSKLQTPENSREVIFPNGSLLIPNLTLSDNDEYIVQVVHSECQVTTIRVHLQVYALRSRGSITPSIFIGAVVQVVLISAFIYILCIRKTERASRGMLGNPILGWRSRPSQKESEDSIVYVNNALLQGFPQLPQDQGSSSISPDAPSENVYQALNVTEIDVYDKITSWKKPQAHGKGKITKS
ncbi:carcinoembryonic antigen-related cell adhesion molecule 3-like [Dromiciops gliroides]|uniref:carcinoembryonic antigen-related cell adhesion molecule 3-like n=1 Tax=Dromiciops gliroides TaxID=33562 RepID=UPI001CC59EA8|nr:carcinoembryonic antigen-related cell adhesion molecule 3-like [Dromiciops gliroides]